jgi:hypothetical protein
MLEKLKTISCSCTWNCKKDFTLGIDYGTNSIRALFVADSIVSIKTGSAY